MSSKIPREFEGNEALHFAATHLRKINVNVQRWEIEYEDALTGEKWLMDYPHSEFQGGGNPRLRKLPLI